MRRSVWRWRRQRGTSPKKCASASSPIRSIRTARWRCKFRAASRRRAKTRRSVMECIDTVRALQARSDAERAAGRRIALVPTMGALHAGHASLFKIARQRADRVWVSIFVNPTQFDDPRDLAAYPRTLAGDVAICRDAGVDLVFTPDAAEIYPAGAQTTVEVGALSGPLCGASRPGHFRGVATVVTKLLAEVPGARC